MRVISTVLLLALAACASIEPSPAVAPSGYEPSSIALSESDRIATACRNAEIPELALARGGAVTVDDEAELDAVALCMVRGPLKDATVGVTSGDDATAQEVKRYLVAHGAKPERIVTGVRVGARVDTAEINVMTPAARVPALPETLPQKPPTPAR